MANIIDFVGPRTWIAKANSVMNELQGSLSDLEAFDQCYLMFSPRDVTPANRKDYHEALEDRVVDKLAECKVMFDGLDAIFGEDRIRERVAQKGSEIFERYEEELTNCVAVAEYMSELKGRLNAESNSKPRSKKV